MEKAKVAKISKEKKVTIYTTKTCPWCMKTKEFFKANNVKYSEMDVGVDEKTRNELFEKSGQFGVPVIDVNGTIIIGYNKDALMKALGM